MDVVDIGLASTDQLYFAAGRLGLPGAMFTASHNPAQYNGIKLCRAGATPVGQDSGLAQIRDMVAEPVAPSGDPAGTVTHRDLLADYAAFLHELVDLSAIRPLKVVVDAGNGMAGHTAPAVLDVPALDVVALYFELDGTFPNHEANPIEAENLRDLQAAVLAEGADLGLAFDGDADRCFLVDERGELVSPSALTGLVAARELAKHPGSPIIHNLITSARSPRGDPRERRGPGAHAGGALVHQGADGRDRGGVRRRALRALLLPRVLERRLRDARRAAHDRRPGRVARGHHAVVDAGAL